MSIKVNLIDSTGATKDQVEIKSEWYELVKGSQAVHETVVAYLASQRNGNASTKTRAEVRGSNAKPWRQKGTGNARAGTKRSPIWTGGGITFGPKPRSYAKSVNKKVKRLALRKAIGERVQANEFLVVEGFDFAKPSTAEAKKFLGAINAADRPVIILDDTAENFEQVNNAFLSFRNIKNIVVVGAMVCNAYDVLSGKNIVITKAALEVLGDRIASASKGA